MPVVIVLYLRHALPRYRVRDDKRRLLDYGFRFVNCRNKCCDIVSVHLEHMPIKCVVLIREGLKRHHVFSISVDLDVIAINDRREPGEAVFPREHRRFPCVPLLLFRVAHHAINVRLQVAGCRLQVFECVGHACGL